MRIDSLGASKLHLNSYLIVGGFASFCMRYSTAAYDRNNDITEIIYSVICYSTEIIIFLYV